MTLLLILNSSNGNYKKVKAYLDRYNPAADEIEHRDALAAWNFETDTTPKKRKVKEKFGSLSAKFETKHRGLAGALLKLNNSDVPRGMMRQLRFITRTVSSKDSKTNQDMSELQSKMTAIYNNNWVRKLNSFHFIYFGRGHSSLETVH